MKQRTLSVIFGAAQDCSLACWLRSSPSCQRHISSLSRFSEMGRSGVCVWVEGGVSGASTLFIIALRIQHSAVHKIHLEGTGVDIKGLQVIAPTEYSG